MPISPFLSNVAGAPRRCTHPENRRFVSKPATRLSRGWLSCRDCGKVVHELPHAATLTDEVASMMQHLLDNRLISGAVISVEDARFDAYALEILQEKIGELRTEYATRKKPDETQ